MGAFVIATLVTAVIGSSIPLRAHDDVGRHAVYSTVRGGHWHDAEAALAVDS